MNQAIGSALVQNDPLLKAALQAQDLYPPNSDYPQGFAMNLTDGIFRCRFHASWEKPEMLEAGRIYAITITPFATANLFKQGHRIRLDISSSNFPRFDVNPNSGE